MTTLRLYFQHKYLMLPVGEIKILRSCENPLFVELTVEENTVLLLVATRATSTKTIRSLALYLLVQILH